jgi:GT2 family glycosyltransferase
MKVSIIILNWNGKRLMQEFLPSVVAHSLSDQSFEVELVVADNGSDDGSLDFLRLNFPNIRLLDLGCNHGFAKGYNLALERVDSIYSILLNSDVEVEVGWLSSLIEYMDAHPDVVACQPKIKSVRQKTHFEHAGACGGYMDMLGYPFCRGRILESVEHDSGQYDAPVDVFWASGACLCIRTSVYKDAGGLDERFFAHMEEIDLCWRLRSRGMRIVCVPSSVVYHLGGATLNKENPHKTYLNYRNNLLMIYKNASSSALFLILFVRFFLDYASAFIFLLSGKRGDAAAVFKARKAFWGLQKSYAAVRKRNLSKQILPLIPEVLKGSILMAYYFKGQKSFSALTAFKSMF